MMKSLKFCLGACAILAAGAVWAAGSVFEWDATKKTGDWFEPGNWTKEAVPSGLDAAKFTIPQGEEWTITVSGDVSVTNLWVYGGGTLHLMMENAPKIRIGGSSDGAPPSIGAGRGAAFVTGKSTLILDGESTFASAHDPVPSYALLQMDNQTSLVVTNGATFRMPARIPYVGSKAVANGTALVVVSGEGSTLDITGSKSELAGGGVVLKVNNKAKLSSFPSSHSSAKNLQVNVTDNAEFSDAHIYFGGVGSRLLVKDSVLSAASGNYLTFPGSKTSGSSGSNIVMDFDKAIINGGSSFQTAKGNNVTLVLNNGTTLNASAVAWGCRTCSRSTLIISNSTVTTTGTTTIGANDARIGSYTGRDMQIIVAEGGAYSGVALQVGKFSTNDTFFVDGGTATFSGAAKIGNASDDVTVNSFVKVRGESSVLSFNSTLSFTASAGIACELPLPKDRAAISCAGKVTLADDTKLEVTVPDDFSQKVTHTLLTGSSIANTIAPENVVVNGKATATVEKSADGKSILLTVKPLSGLMLILR